MIYARRHPSLAMLERASIPPEGEAGVPVVEVEGLIGLKLQAMENDPRRRRQDEADIVQLLSPAPALAQFRFARRILRAIRSTG